MNEFDYQKIYPGIKRILFSREQIERKTGELAKRISEDYKDKTVTLVSVLKGGTIFLADLLRYLEIKAEIDFMAISSYGTETTTGVVRIIKDLDIDIQGKDVLIIEDIVDTGLTLNYLVKNLLSRQPNSLNVCTLLDRPHRRFADIGIKYVGFEISDVFVVGYGLDYNGLYRQLPYIAVLKPEFVYE